MFKRLYVYASVNWRMLLALVLLAALGAGAIATQIQWVPQTTLIAVNWDSKMNGQP